MSIQVSWLGSDGTFWDLTTGPVQIDGDSSNGVEGFGEPKWNRNTIETAGSDGQRRTGQRSRASAREGYLPVIILGDNEGSWVDLSRSWWNSWSPDIPGTLTVTMPDGTTRAISACLVDDDSYAPARDPGLNFSEETAVTWVADDPFWYGPAQTAAFQVVDGTTDFFNGGAAPPFNLAPGNTINSASVSNPGDLEAWPTYILTGPATTFSVGVAGHTVAGSVTVEDGETLIVDSAPSRQVALLYRIDGTVANVTPQLSAVDFGSVPARSSAPLDVSVAGSGQLTITFAPRYRRAW